MLQILDYNCLDFSRKAILTLSTDNLQTKGQILNIF